MRNPLSFRVESLMGSLFLAGIALFFVAFLFITMKNFNSDIESETVQTANQLWRIKKISELNKQILEKEIQ